MVEHCRNSNTSSLRAKFHWEFNIRKQLLYVQHIKKRISEFDLNV